MKKPRIFSLVMFVLIWAVSAKAQTYSVLYSFGSHPGDPGHPGNPGIIAQGTDGNLYGTTWAGGSQGAGAIFSITPAGKLTVLHSFNGGSDGAQPNGGLTLGTDGNFYGTASDAGAFGEGTLFRITPRGNFTVLYTFTGGSDGGGPFAPPIEGIDGSLYGTTEGGGPETPFGTIYKLSPSDELTTLHAFSGEDGAFPMAPLVLATDGNFYGTTSTQGALGAGTVFRITPTGNFAVLYACDYTNTDGPLAPLIQGTDGNLYGTTIGAGNGTRGTVFQLSRTGNVRFVHELNGTTDGGDLFAGVVQASDGSLYGTATDDGSDDSGVIYRISPKGVFSVTYYFDGSNGGNPYVTPFQHTNGILYGDTDGGGTNFEGVFYSIDVKLKPFASPVLGGGRVGRQVGIRGQGFTGTTGVSFNGISASFRVRTDTYLTAIVPVGATTGQIEVRTPGGTLPTCRNFVVVP